MSGPCTPITKAVLPPLPAARIASAPSSRSFSLNVVHALAIWGHMKPWTSPRLQNFTSAARPSRSSLLSSVKGEKPIGNTPANSLPREAAAHSPGTPNEAAPAPNAPRNDRRSSSVMVGPPSKDTTPLLPVAGCRRHRRRWPESIAKLIGHPRQFPVGKHHVQKLLAIHRPAVFVLELPDDLAALHIDDIPRRDVGEVTIQPHRDPVGTGGGLDALHLLRRHPGVVEDVNVVVDAVREPELFLIVRQGDAVTRTAVGNSRPRSDVPLLGPSETLHFHLVQNPAAFHIGDHEAQQVIGVRID